MFSKGQKNDSMQVNLSIWCSGMLLWINACGRGFGQHATVVGVCKNYLSCSILLVDVDNRGPLKTQLSKFVTKQHRNSQERWTASSLNHTVTVSRVGSGHLMMCLTLGSWISSSSVAVNVKNDSLRFWQRDNVSTPERSPHNLPPTKKTMMQQVWRYFIGSLALENCHSSNVALPSEKLKSSLS